MLAKLRAENYPKLAYIADDEKVDAGMKAYGRKAGGKAAAVLLLLLCFYCSVIFSFAPRHSSLIAHCMQYTNNNTNTNTLTH
jgi:hypothetical protein